MEGERGRRAVTSAGLTALTCGCGWQTNQGPIPTGRKSQQRPQAAVRQLRPDRLPPSEGQPRSSRSKSSAASSCRAMPQCLRDVCRPNSDDGSCSWQARVSTRERAGARRRATAGTAPRSPGGTHPPLARRPLSPAFLLVRGERGVCRGGCRAGDHADTWVVTCKYAASGPQGTDGCQGECGWGCRRGYQSGRQGVLPHRDRGRGFVVARVVGVGCCSGRTRGAGYGGAPCARRGGRR